MPFYVSAKPRGEHAVHPVDKVLPANRLAEAPSGRFVADRPRAEA
jgi:hypothetical protein